MIQMKIPGMEQKHLTVHLETRPLVGFSYNIGTIAEIFVLGSRL